MAKPYGAQQYKQTQVMTANRGQLVVLLYEGAIKQVRKAADCVDRKDMVGKGVAIGRAHDIINELNSALDHSVGGKVSQDLENLYNFCVEQLLKANAENSRAPLESVGRILENLLEGWRGAVAELTKSGELK